MAASDSETDTNHLLKFKHDMYGGVRVDADDLKFDLEAEFEARLKASLKFWLETGVGGVWIRIPLDKAWLVPVCGRYGLDFHHAQPGYVMMTRWLLVNQRSILPNYANQYLGCAGFVVNDKNEVLVVKERYTHTFARWKLPGGHANVGEDIGEAAVRETREETGIQCQFVSVLCIRHMHHYRHGLSDLYAMCLLKPLSDNISIDREELTDCKWMDIDEWLASDVTSTNRHCGELYKQIQNGNAQAIYPHVVQSWDRKQNNLIYDASVSQTNRSNQDAEDL